MAKSLRRGWLLLFCLSLASCSPSKQTPQSPQAEAGFLNLQGWDFNKGGPVDLSGEWEFYWHQLLLPAQVGTSTNFIYTPVPELWTNYEIDGERLPPEGYATYRLVVQLPDPSQVYGLAINGEGSAYALWVDGELAAENGQVADNAHDSIPKNIPETVFFYPKGNSTEFVLQIANFNHRKAGFRNEIVLALPEQIHAAQRDQMSREAAILGIYLVMVLYHLFIYAFRPADKSPLYFALWSLLFFVRTGLLNQKILVLLLPAMSWNTALRLEYFTFYFTPAIYALFVQSLYPRDIERWVMRIVMGLAVLFSMYMFFTDTLTLSYSISIYQAILLLETMYFVFFLGRILVRKREGASYIALASAIGLTGIILEILSIQNVVPIKLDGTGTFLAFILIQAIMLSSRLSKSFRRVEVLSDELEETNIKLSVSERKYRSIFEEAKDMIFIAGLDERIREANRSSQEMLGYTQDELRAMKMSDLVVHPEDRQQIENTLRDQAVVKDYELELQQKSGGIIHGLVTLTFRRNNSDEVSEIQGRVHDISARKHAEAERMRALEFEKLAITDPLTHIYNRRMFDEIANKEWERARRSKSMLTVVLFDVDHFKMVNDTYGHLTGDEVLIRLAELCTSNLRSMDVFARYGGEEFVVLMPDADETSALQSVERLRKMVESTCMVTFENADVFITISAGIATKRGQKIQDFNVLLERADQALYASKEAGRNCVTVWQASKG